MNTSRQDVIHESRFNAILGRAAFLFITLAGLFTCLTGMDDAIPSQVASLCVLALLYVVVGLFIYPRIETSQPTPALVTYFAVQLMLGLFICVLGNVVGRGQGTIWLVLLPLISQAVICLPSRGAVLVAALSIVVFCLALWMLYQRADALAVLLCVAGVMFAFFFTHIAVRERQTRLKLEKLEEELRQSNRKLSEYAPQVETMAAMREQYQLARQSNETLSKCLQDVNAQVKAARVAISIGPTKAGEALAIADTLLHEGLVKARYTAAALRATPMDQRNLIDAIDVLVDETRDSGLNANLAVAGPVRALPAQIERTLYRTAQEGLTGVHLHTHATHVGLLLTFEDDCVRLSVRDDGIAITDAATDDLGLAQLREEMNLLGGTMRIHQAGGFVLEVEIPA